MDKNPRAVGSENKAGRDGTQKTAGHEFQVLLVLLSFLLGLLGNVFITPEMTRAYRWVVTQQMAHAKLRPIQKGHRWFFGTTYFRIYEFTTINRNSGTREEGWLELRTAVGSISSLNCPQSAYAHLPDGTPATAWNGDASSKMVKVTLPEFGDRHIYYIEVVSKKSPIPDNALTVQLTIRGHVLQTSRSWP